MVEEPPSARGVPGSRAPLVGAHVSAAGGLLNAIDNARELGCETFQVFVSNPRGWAEPVPDPDGAERFRRAAAAAGFAEIFVHAPYLVNFASLSDQFAARSRRLVGATLARAAAIGAVGVVVHAGSDMGGGRERGIARTREAVLRLLDRPDPGEPDLVIEFTAGTRGSIAARFEQMAELLAACDDHPRLKVCFDTCHAHAAGYDLSEPCAAAALDELFAAVGDRVRLVHANDAAEALGSARDHHVAIGKGHIGEAGFAAILGHARLAGLPVIIETPGTAAERAADVARLKRLRPT